MIHCMYQSRLLVTETYSGYFGQNRNLFKAVVLLTKFPRRLENQAWEKEGPKRRGSSQNSRNPWQQRACEDSQPLH